MNYISSYVNNGGKSNCFSLCSSLPDSSKTQKATCLFLCGINGYSTFTYQFTQSGLDPILYCEKLSQCQIKSSSSGAINSIVISPEEAPNNTNFTISVEYSVTSQLGTALLSVEITDPNSKYYVDAILLVETPVGNYQYDFIFETQPSNYHPMIPGNYSVIIQYGEDPGSVYHGGHLFGQIEKNLIILPSGSSYSQSSNNSSSPTGYVSGSSYF